MQDEELGPAVDLKDPLTLNSGLELAGRRKGDRTPPTHVSRQDGLAGQLGAKRAGEGFDFGQLRHTRG